MKNLCVIPARAASKRIPHKNIREFNGTPIIEYPLNEAIKSKLFDKIMITTDDKRILIDYSEFAYVRSPMSATDKATLADAVLDLGADLLSQYDYVCLLLPTAVFTTKDDLIKSFDSAKYSQAVTTLTKYSHPIQRAFEIKGSSARMVLDESIMMSRTQDLAEYYHDAGQFYWLHTESFLKQKKIFMKDLGYYKIDYCIDIDNEADWKNAEQYLRGKL
jgi:N-acylneuraminate cytidylyltransferase